MMLPSPVQEISFLSTASCQLFIKRDDLIHPVISGNKWRKLTGWMELYHRGHFSGIVSWGGVWSNHLHAAAYICHLHGIPFKALVRGETETAMIQDMLNWGASLEFISREAYRTKERGFLPENYLEIPEGGAGEPGLRGWKAFWEELPFTPDTICLPVGTGTSLEGLMQQNFPGNLIGFSAIKNPLEIQAKLQRDRVEITDAYCGGGYAKMTPEIREFALDFERNTGILPDPVYGVKMWMGIADRIRKNILPGNRILVLHTGGVQGWRGFR